MNKGGQDALAQRLPQMAAAGGLALAEGHGLLIRKHGLWDLPKGKRRGREAPERCAIREIAEETGLDPGRFAIRAPLCRSSYISYYSFGPVNKTVDWFLLDYGGKLTDPLAPELSEDIDLCRWVDLSSGWRIYRPAPARIWRRCGRRLSGRCPGWLRGGVAIRGAGGLPDFSAATFFCDNNAGWHIRQRQGRRRRCQGQICRPD